MSKKNKFTPSKGNKIKNANWQFWLIIALPVIYAIVFAYVPMGGILMAFKDYSPRRGILGSEWVGLKVSDFHIQYYSYQKYPDPRRLLADRKLPAAHSPGYRPE